ncbi:MAG: leucine-rich repeat protein [Clostridia bacterium]|nr:leucine-rich repeat protein [Clostridia bacterium]
MKKKLILALTLVAMLACIFAISVSAATVYKTENGAELFRYVDENGDYDFDSYTGSFPKTDADGNELTWYFTNKSTVGSDTVYTVASKITLGEAGSLNENGEFSFTSPVTNKNTLSVNYPDNAGILKIPAFGAYNTRAQNNILFAYLPNTLTALPESLFQETPVIVGEIDDETPVTMIPHKLCHEARNIKVVNIPAAVTFIDSIDDRNGAPFCNTKSLKTVTFAENSQLTRICSFAFIGSGIEEIQFPASLVSVNQNLFRSCSSLRVIRFGESFQYFENVSRDGKITTVHQSLTHTATALQEIYLPASFYATKPDVNYRVSYAFDGCYNAKFFFVGTKAQLDTSIANFVNEDWTTGATDHNYIVTAYNNNKIVTWAEYSKNPDNYAGQYIITDYNVCDAFHAGQHDYDVEYGFVGDEYLSDYCAYSTCQDCGKKTTEVIAGALFTNKGYAKALDGSSFTYGISVNRAEIEKYEIATGEKVSYGLLAAKKDVSSTGLLVNTDGTLAEGVISANLTENIYSIFNMKLTGISDENKTTEIYCCAYAVIGDTVAYFGKGVDTKAYLISSDAIENVEE